VSHAEVVREEPGCLASPMEAQVQATGYLLDEEMAEELATLPKMLLDIGGISEV
jgi:hypothetical protein